MTTQAKRTLSTRALVESALLVAAGFALSYLVLFEMPSGGSVTAVSMLPVLLVGLRRGPRLGLMAGVVFGGLQMLQKFWAPPTRTFWAFVAVVALDYVIAFGVLGLSGLFRKWRWGLLAAVPVCLGLRFVCHWTVGAIIWYMGEINPWVLSAGYNAPYMAIELATTAAAAVVLCGKKLDRLML